MNILRVDCENLVEILERLVVQFEGFVGLGSVVVGLLVNAA